MVRAEAAAGLRLLSRHRLTWLDVFTRRPLEGNQLAVVHDADGVPASVQQAFALETKLSETTFLQSSSTATYRNRIWTTTREMDFAGHPSLGTAVAVAAVAGAGSASYTQQTRVGVQPVDVKDRGDHWHATMLLEAAEFGDELDAAALLDALGLTPDDAHPELPARQVGCGEPRALLAVRDAAVLDRIVPRRVALEAALAASGSDLVYPFALTGGDGVEARSLFLDTSFVGEDPATGSSAGPLMAYLARHAAMTTARISQGVAMGRPSVLDVAVEDDRVRLSGDCVLVADGSVTLPDRVDKPGA